MQRVEIATGGGCDPGLGEHAAAEGFAVAGQCRHVDIEVERPVGRREAAEPRLAQRRDQPVTVGAVARDMRIELGAALPNTGSAASCDSAGGEM